MIRLPLLAVAVAVAGCAAFERKVEYVPFEVRVPVAVPCSVDPGPAPAWETEKLTKADTLDAKAQALLAERQQRMAYEARLKAAADGCR